MQDTTGTHESGLMTLHTESNIQYPYSFATLSGGKLRTCSGKESMPLAVVTDVAGINEPVAAHILGSNAGTMKAMAAEPILPGDKITANENGLACPVDNQSKGTYYICGIALGRANSGGYIEFTPTMGMQIENK